MEKLPQKVQDDIIATEDFFTKWLGEMQNLCMIAAFRKEQTIMTILQQNLVKNQEAITTMLQDLSLHLNTAPVPLAVSSSAPSQTSGNRMAANFPKMTAPSPAVASPFTAAKVGTPMAVASSVASSGELKDKHVFMEKYTSPLPNDWRSGKSFSSVVGAAPPPQGPSSNGGSSVDDIDETDNGGVNQPNKVFLLNIARDSTSKSIAKYFEGYGSVVDVKIFRFPNGDSRGQGWIEFLNDRDADQAIRDTPHRIDGRDVESKAFVQRDPRNGPKPPVRTYQIFLGGLPSHLSREEVKAELSRHVGVRDIRLISERGYAYLDVESEKDVDSLLRMRRIKIGEKFVECKENRRP